MISMDGLFTIYEASTHIARTTTIWIFKMNKYPLSLYLPCSSSYSR